MELNILRHVKNRKKYKGKQNKIAIIKPNLHLVGKIYFNSLATEFIMRERDIDLVKCA